jgi:hypothetical protein
MITVVEGNQSQAVAFPGKTYHPRRESQRKRNSKARPTIGATNTSNGSFISLKNAALRERKLMRTGKSRKEKGKIACIEDERL